MHHALCVCMARKEGESREKDGAREVLEQLNVND